MTINKTLKHLNKFISRLKLLDWFLIGFSIISICAFAIVFFRKSSYIVATISVGEDSAVYGLWAGDVGPKYWYSNSFYVGQTEKNGLGNVQAKILDIYSYDVTSTHTKVYLNTELRVIYNKASDTYTYNGTPVLIGSTIKLNFKDIYAEGLVTNIEGVGKSVEKGTVTVDTQIREDNPVYSGTSGTKPYVANAVNAGDTVRDNNGNVLIEILSKRVEPAAATATTNNGVIVKTTNPLRNDVYLTIRIHTSKINNKNFFLGDIPILVDQSFPINLPNITFFPTVTKFVSSTN